MSNALPFECSHDNCNTPCAGDFCPAHQPVSFLVDGDDYEDEENGCYCGNGCDK